MSESTHRTEGSPWWLRATLRAGPPLFGDCAHAPCGHSAIHRTVGAGDSGALLSVDALGAPLTLAGEKIIGGESVPSRGICAKSDPWY